MTDADRTQRGPIRSQSESETESIGEALGRRLDRGLCVCLVGPLGSGKSVMARGMCKGLGVQETVVSPTFILCEEYAGRVPVLHLDLYRLEHEREVAELGVFDRLGDAVVVAEWGERSPYLFERADVIVHLRMTGPSERTILVDCTRSAASVLEEF